MRTHWIGEPKEAKKHSHEVRFTTNNEYFFLDYELLSWRNLKAKLLTSGKGALQFSSTPPFGLPGHPTNLNHTDFMDDRSSLWPAPQYDTPQRAMRETREELTEGREMKEDNLAESQLRSWGSCWRPLLILASPTVFSNRKIPHTNPAVKLGSYNC